MSSAADGSATFELDAAALTGGLADISARFGQISEQINRGFGAANRRLNDTASAADHVSSRFGRVGAALAALSRGAANMTGLNIPISAAALALAPLAAGALGVASGFGILKKSIGAAAETQGLESSFVTLLGSAKAARDRMAELSSFAASTPFEIPSVVNASRVLESLTKGAISTGEGLRMVGDAAALTGEPIEGLAVHIGRMYDGLMNGAPVGEASGRLQELGLITSTTKGRIEALQKAGVKGNEVWQLAAKDLAKFSGEMERQSATWNGMMSNASDGVAGLFRAFGAPIITALTPFMQKMLVCLGGLTAWAEKAGAIFSGWVGLLAQIFGDGKIGEALFLSLKVADMKIINLLISGFMGAGNVLGQILLGVGKMFLSVVSAVTKLDFWKGVANGLKAAAEAFSAILLRGMAKLYESLAKLPGMGDLEGTSELMKSQAWSAENAAMRSSRAAGAGFDPLSARLADDFNATMKAAAASFSEGFDGGKGFIDTGAAEKELAAFIRPFALRAQAAITSTSAQAAKGGLPPPVPSADSPDADMGAKGKGSNSVAGLQKIGGGGGFSVSRADPILRENQKQTDELKGMRSELAQLRAAVARKPGTASAVFTQ